jgi:Kef-type K+ transport system membrane component KefB
MSSDVLGQIHATMLPLWTGNLGSSINNIILIVGVLTGLFYFFFSVEHKGALKVVSRIGIYFLMIYFGASFGFAVMGRISLLIGRFNDLILYSSKSYGFATPIILVIMIVVLIITARKEKSEPEEL